MSVTIIVAIGFALAGSYIEFRARKASALVNSAYKNFWFSLVMTGIIGAGVTLLTGPAVGIGAVLGQLIGLATNEFTYKLYDEYIPAMRVRWVMARYKAEGIKRWSANNKQTISDFKTGVKGFFALIAAVFICFGKIIRYTGLALSFIAHPVENTKARLAR